jgi:hypothetical protein
LDAFGEAVPFFAAEELAVGDAPFFGSGEPPRPGSTSVPFAGSGGIWFVCECGDVLAESSVESELCRTEPR